MFASIAKYTPDRPPPSLCVTNKEIYYFISARAVLCSLLIIVTQMPLLAVNDHRTGFVLYGWSHHGSNTPSKFQHRVSEGARVWVPFCVMKLQQCPFFRNFLKTFLHNRVTTIVFYDNGRFTSHSYRFILRASLFSMFLALSNHSEHIREIKLRDLRSVLKYRKSTPNKLTKPAGREVNLRRCQIIFRGWDSPPVLLPQQCRVKLDNCSRILRCPVRVARRGVL